MAAKKRRQSKALDLVDAISRREPVATGDEAIDRYLESLPDEPLPLNEFGLPTHVGQTHFFYGGPNQPSKAQQRMIARGEQFFERSMDLLEAHEEGIIDDARYAELYEKNAVAEHAWRSKHNQWRDDEHRRRSELAMAELRAGLTISNPRLRFAGPAPKPPTARKAPPKKKKRIASPPPAHGARPRRKKR